MPAFEYFPMEIYRLMRWPTSTNTDFCFPVLSGMGCKWKCLAGDTLINTINGMVPIVELVGKKAKVLTYDKENNDILYADAIHIRKTGENEQLVRVHFDDGTHIDCTPDHRFKRFVNGNQSVPVREYDTEAKDLKPKDSVRAVKYTTSKKWNDVNISWRRNKYAKEHRLKMEATLGRKLSIKEHVHHKDGIRNNNDLDNLIVVHGRNHAPFFHPEISERMRNNNPAKNMTPEWREKIGKAITGKVRSYESRLKYRESKLGKKNPNYKHGEQLNKMSRVLKDPNHKVVSVEWLDKKEDTYCMEVPGYDWFYANNVLVHNCTFCYRMDKGFRPRSVDGIIEEINLLKKSR